MQSISIIVSFVILWYLITTWDHYINSTVKSPCIKKCELDENSICTGCYRSITEICNWDTMDNDRKTKVLLNSKLRKYL